MLGLIKRKLPLNRINFLFLVLIFCTLPFALNLNAIVLGLYVAFLIIFLEKRKISRSKVISAVGLGAFFWISIFWLKTTNAKDLNFILRLLPLALLPFGFVLKKINANVKEITIAVTVSSICVTLFGVYTAIEFYSRPDQHFSFIHLPHMIQGNYDAVYFAIQLGVNVMLLLTIYRDKKKIIHLLIAMVFIGLMVLLGKRMALFSLTLLVMLWAITNVGWKKLLPFVLIVLTVSILFFLSPYNRWRASNISQKGEGMERAIMLTSSGEVVKNNVFLGVGTNKVSQNLEIVYNKKGIDTPFYSNNPHNQFLYILVAYGIVGFLVYLSLQVYFVRQAWILRNKIFLYILAFFTLVSLTETILIRQQGIILYSLVLSYLFYNKESLNI